MTEGTPLGDAGYPGFVVHPLARLPWADEGVFEIECGGAVAAVRVTRHELLFAHDPGRLVGGKVVDACERMWSRWMAL